ncbi:hypothetical protein [Photorhabdus heterorhabditis]|uniref:hypothetical protein n=1 Tax=Photorhabdus heterorhabditis TaxID=880156 RepID=UPI0015622C7D|nr:hypothetical protein [Photorhabdus heterorhabditis]NRN28963.1 hypothetical protein [Photorhabdus heterorhabditis subsp. aluminescens]
MIYSTNNIIPVIFQVASWLAALTHPGHRVIYTLHLSSCCFVGCVHLPQSHRYLCSWGLFSCRRIAT